MVYQYTTDVAEEKWHYDKERYVGMIHHSIYSQHSGCVVDGVANTAINIFEEGSSWLRQAHDVNLAHSEKPNFLKFLTNSCLEHSGLVLNQSTNFCIFMVLILSIKIGWSTMYLWKTWRNRTFSKRENTLLSAHTRMRWPSKIPCKVSMMANGQYPQVRIRGWVLPKLPFPLSSTST